jgi:hypothetical protein
MANRTFLKDPQNFERTVEVSAGVADAGKIPNVNAAGVLDRTVTNAVQTSAGAPSSGQLAALDSSGRLDSTMMPVGVAADTAVITTSEVIAAGAWVNIFNSSGAKARNADASNSREAHGFTLLGAGSGAPCTVYLEGVDTAVSGKTPGATQYLSDVTPGASQETQPVTAGHLLQRLGVATSATSISAMIQTPVTLA